MLYPCWLMIQKTTSNIHPLQHGMILHFVLNSWIEDEIYFRARYTHALQFYRQKYGTYIYILHEYIYTVRMKLLIHFVQEFAKNIFIKNDHDHMNVAYAARIIADFHLSMCSVGLNYFINIFSFGLYCAWCALYANVPVMMWYVYADFAIKLNIV